MKHRIEHRLVQQRVPHPLGDNHIHLGVFGGSWIDSTFPRTTLRRVSAPGTSGDPNARNVRDHICIAVGLDDFFWPVRDLARVHHEHLFRPCASDE